LILDARATLGEGPIWDSRDDVLWWLDIEEHKLHRYAPVAQTNDTVDVGQCVGTVVPRRQGGLMLAVENGFASYDPPTRTLEVVAEPEAHLPENRFNDGKCDPAGRFWAGTMQIDEKDMAAGSLYCLHANGKVEKQVSDIGVANGIVWTSDQRTMYYIDSPTGRVDAFDYDNSTGSLSNRRVAFEIPEGMGLPDGMAIDAEDHVWVALWGGWCLACFEPRTGELLAKVEVPAGHVTACAFGGPDLGELYITTARYGLQGEELDRQPHAGGLFRAGVDVRGTLFTSFAG